MRCTNTRMIKQVLNEVNNHEESTLNIIFSEVYVTPTYPPTNMGQDSGEIGSELTVDSVDEDKDSIFI